jgi:hypothetical protein
MTKIRKNRKASSHVIHTFLVVPIEAKDNVGFTAPLVNVANVAYLAQIVAYLNYHHLNTFAPQKGRGKAKS